MRKMGASNILISGINGLGVEIGEFLFFLALLVNKFVN